MWNATRRMAEAIADGIRDADPSITVKLFSASKPIRRTLSPRCLPRAVLMGSPTVNNGYLYAIAGILELIRGAKLKEEGAARQLWLER